MTIMQMNLWISYKDISHLKKHGTIVLSTGEWNKDSSFDLNINIGDGTNNDPVDLFSAEDYVKELNNKSRLKSYQKKAVDNILSKKIGTMRTK